MKSTIKKVKESNTSKTSIKKNELKQQTTALTLRVLPMVLDELGVPLEGLTEAQIKRLVNGVVQLSEKIFDSMSKKANKDGFEMNLSDRYAATALVTYNFVSMFKSFKNIPTWHIACLITSKIVECDQLSEEYANRVYEYCIALIDKVRNQENQ